jgi:hypothetical protein
MECRNCGYLMDPLDDECPRCAKADEPQRVEKTKRVMEQAGVSEAQARQALKQNQWDDTAAVQALGGGGAETAEFQPDDDAPAAAPTGPAGPVQGFPPGVGGQGPVPPVRPVAEDEIPEKPIWQKIAVVALIVVVAIVAVVGVVTVVRGVGSGPGPALRLARLDHTQRLAKDDPIVQPYVERVNSISEKTGETPGEVVDEAEAALVTLSRLFEEDTGLDVLKAMDEALTPELAAEGLTADEAAGAYMMGRNTGKLAIGEPPNLMGDLGGGGMTVNDLANMDL